MFQRCNSGTVSCVLVEKLFLEMEEMQMTILDKRGAAQLLGVSVRHWMVGSLAGVENALALLESRAALLDRRHGNEAARRIRKARQHLSLPSGKFATL